MKTPADPWCRRLLIVQDVPGNRLDARSFAAGVRLNATALAGSFTPEFESVFYGDAPYLGPDPELVSDLTALGTLINVAVWSAAAVFGIDKIGAVVG